MNDLTFVSAHFICCAPWFSQSESVSSLWLARCQNGNVSKRSGCYIADFVWLKSEAKSVNSIACVEISLKRLYSDVVVTVL